MDVRLSSEEIEELDRVLKEALGDLSPEIAGTDNAAYRAELERRREILRLLHRRITGT